MDKYEYEYQEALKKLKECEKRVEQSCMPCEKIVDCPIRQEYVAKTYATMNHGNTGGFEF